MSRWTFPGSFDGRTFLGFGNKMGALHMEVMTKAQELVFDYRPQDFHGNIVKI